MHPYVAILIGVLSVASSAIFVKLSSADAGTIAFYRMLFSVMLMLPLFVGKHRHELKMIDRKQWAIMFLSGTFLAFHFILWFESLRYTSVASSTVLVTLQPLFAIIGTYILFKEPITRKTLVAAVITIGGSVLLAWGDVRIGGTALFGDMLALIACALISFYMLCGQSVRQHISSTTYTIIVYAVSALVLAVYIPVKGESFGPYPSIEWLWFILLAIIPNLLGHNLFNWSLKFVSANAISIAILFEPVGASILAYFIFKEQLHASQVVGGIIVLAGIIFYTIDENKFKKFFQKNY
jgi:drug/metabolite transporter (DMT)-like permease